jgi:hypothetical protein
MKIVHLNIRHAIKVKKSSSYFWLTLAITFTHLIFMRFVFQEEWGSSPLVTGLVRKMTSIVPMIRLLEKFPKYDIYWGVFYSALWIISPVFFVFGYASGRLAEEKELIFIKKSPKWKFLFFLAFFSGAVTFAFFFPDVGTRFWFNELSENLLIIAFTSLQIATVIFLLGRGLALTQIKLTKNISNPEE